LCFIFQFGAAWSFDWGAQGLPKPPLATGLRVVLPRPSKKFKMQPSKKNQCYAPLAPLTE